MSAIKIAAIMLIVAGVLGLVYGGFTYPVDSQATKLGPVELVVTDKERINIPIWAGVGAIAVGSVLLLLVGIGSGRKWE